MKGGGRERGGHRTRTLLTVSVLVLAAAGACTSGRGTATLTTRADQRPVPTTTTPAYVSFVAQVKQTVTSIGIYDSPQTAQPTQTLPNPWLVDPGTPTSTVAQIFLIEQQTAGWLKILLPVRPNGSTGWIRADDAVIIPTPFHITVSLSAHTITVTNANQTVYQGRVAVGAPDTPTPTGSYYLRVLVKALDPTTVYGPYAYGLSSHSNALSTFNGGDAEIGIHGNNDASALGKDVTHGCVRMDNDAITMLSTQLLLGTPVDIVA